MRPKIRKSLAKFLKIWLFLSIFLLKEAFPHAAYALSSIDSCAVQPTCAEAIGLEIGANVAAPTSTGLGQATIAATSGSTGTANAVVTSIGRVGVVVGAVGGGYAIWHYWNQGNNEQAQNKAKEKYCATYPNDEVCGIPARTVTGNPTTFEGDCFINLYYEGELFDTQGVYPVGVSNVTWEPGINPHGYPSYELIVYTTNNTKVRTYRYAWNQSYDWSLRSAETSAKPWKDWPQSKRDEAVSLLEPSDWQNLVSSMPQGGLLEPGDTLDASKIVIPGQETDDPNTPEDDRPLRIFPGIYTMPGNPDFDRDSIPDTTDPDDDNDGVPDASDLDPHDSNVPSPPTSASGGSGSGDSGGSGDPQDPGAEVTPQVLQDVYNIANKYPNTKCVDCANEIEKYLKTKNIRGRRVVLDTPKSEPRNFNVYDDSLPPKSDGGVIADNGHHEGIAIRINGEEKVFDNHHPDGVPTEQWKNNLTFFGKEHLGQSFKESGYLF
ncbi:hypothetical protein WA1_41645 [Scytonema hofmannii PCC 7110]|uniref:Tox-PL-2 domain-containing protein n=1 Tax=Scytonema hofmannii PCC 7110 TaxID=128403 RepID=A0A139WUX7_9CYAN|nr:papain fold toxin domain-containing protein [Scytonema hofmannii]KYC36234.1 hypothetical protein WA1_41645 [Scytonema hofmannii PCC 7110]